MKLASSLVVVSLLTTSCVFAQVAPTSDFDYDVSMLPEEVYDASIPTPEAILGFELGERAAFPSEIVVCFEAWAEASPRAQLVEYARSHEGRPLYYMVITSEANLARMEDIKSGLSRIADPRGLSDGDAEALLDGLPATAWMGYSIHGDETSGSDAAMLVAYHLIASQSDVTREWLDKMVILIDPVMNPDGRKRFLSQVEEHRGAVPNVDDQSLLHTGFWPWGRMNHYLFDLNRDWLLAVHPESRGRIRAASEWHPLLLVDAHEMGAQSTYLFSPDTEPLNLHFADYLVSFAERFGQDQAKAFDGYGWQYYNGEWADNWYPGYSTSWGRLRGAVSVLYEQAGLTEDGVRRPEGTVITYREAVHHQAVSSWTNLRTLYELRDELKRGFLQDRRSLTSNSGPYAQRTYAILPTANRSRLNAFLDLMDVQGIEYSEAASSVSADAGRDMLGIAFEDRELPEGTILIAGNQPNARTAAAMLEFDGRLSEDVLRKERKSILQGEGSVMYDVTGWSLPMWYGLDALEIDAAMPDRTRPVSRSQVAEAPIPSSTVGYVIDGADDASVAAAARLMERGVAVRVAEKELKLGSESYSAGSVVVLVSDNRDCDCELARVAAESARETGVLAEGLSTGQGAGDLPDLGGSHFTLMTRPSIALAARGQVHPYNFGSIWHTLDMKVGIRHSHVDADDLDQADLRRYNVMVLPGRWSGTWSESTLKTLKSWVEGGGTLIATGTSVSSIASTGSGIGTVRLLKDVLGDLDKYEVAVRREWQAAQKTIPDVDDVWSNTVGDEGPAPWDPDYERADSTKLMKEDAWRRLFMPRGAPIIAGRANAEHWLTFGAGESVSVGYTGTSILMSAPPAEAPVRAGVLVQRSGATATRVGWSGIPAGNELYLRQSGLLWPEAAQRLANAPLVTRERVGKGQVILFAFEPTFRGTMPENTRLLLNAMIFGPGFGTSTAIDL